MLGGFKARDTRWLNELRRKAFGYFISLAKATGSGLPAILRHSEGGCELSIDLGDGYRFRRFKTWTEAGDYLIDIAPHC